MADGAPWSQEHYYQGSNCTRLALSTHMAMGGVEPGRDVPGRPPATAYVRQATRWPRLPVDLDSFEIKGRVASRKSARRSSGSRPTRSIYNINGKGVEHERHFFHSCRRSRPWRRTACVPPGAGEVLEIDVEDRLRRHSSGPILDPSHVFTPCPHQRWGHGIEWIDEEFGADNVYAWAGAGRRVSHEMFDDWMSRNGLSLSGAAEALGISRRMVSFYRTAHKSIPRQTWLACLGWEAVKPEARSMPRSLPTALEYAALHA